MQRAFLIVAALGLGTLAVRTSTAEAPAAVDPAQFPNYSVLEPNVAASGQPTPEGLRRLAALGFETVVNLRTEQEGAEAERTVVEAAGLRYVSVPVTAETLSLASITAVETALADPAAGQVLLHCASSNRVGAVWAAIQMRRGKPVEQAEAAGRAAGLKNPALLERVRRLLAEPTPMPPMPARE